MNQPIVFADVLDAAEQLDAGAEQELVAILSRRLAERAGACDGDDRAGASASSPPASAGP